MDTEKFFKQAMQSSWGLTKLNFLLKRFIPFNSPHGFHITELTPDSATTKIPYIRKNMNHLKGLHACCLATATEYTSGIALGNKFGLSKYRLIMKTLSMEYVYQGKMEAFVKYHIPQNIIESIEKFEIGDQDKLLITCEVKTFDIEKNHLCTGTIEWQLKKWNKVRTR